MPTNRTVRTNQVLLISYHYYPDPAVGSRRPTEFVKELVRQGWKVDVLTAGMKERNERQPDGIGHVYRIKELPDPVNGIWKLLRKLLRNKFLMARPTYENKSTNSTEQMVLRKDVYVESDETLLLKIRRYLLSYQALLSAKKIWFLICLFKILQLRLQGKKYDLIITSSPPSVVNLLGMIAKRVFATKWMCDLRDPVIQWEHIYRECICDARKWVENKLEEKYIATADKITVTTPGLKKHIESRWPADGPDEDRIQVIFNGYDAPQLFCTKHTKPTESLIIIYAGSLYMNRNPLPFFEALRLLIESGGIQPDRLSVYFYGDCNTWNEINLCEWVNNHHLHEIVHFMGNVQVEKLHQVYSSASLLLVFAQEQPLQVPAKIFEYIPYSATILAITEADSDTSNFLGANNLGVVSGPTQYEILTALKSIHHQRNMPAPAGKNNLAKIKPRYSRAAQNRVFIELCKELAL